LLLHLFAAQFSLLKRLLSTILFTLTHVAVLHAQRIDVDLFGGICNYQGDLQPVFITMTQSRPAGFIVVKYCLTEKIFIRSGIAVGSLQGDDKVNKEDLRLRNLRFQSGLKELHVAGEYRFLKADQFALTPYVFLGGGIYHFNPYTRYMDDKKIYLQPLGTEGQGLPEYPQKKMYSLTQFSVVYGGGFKWQLNCNLNVGFEFGQRKLFTDYLDDVSGSFASEEALRNGRGPLAADVAYRRDELDNKPYPDEGSGRGNPRENDWYYFAGFTIGLRLNDCETGGFSLGGLFRGKGRSGGNRNQLRCPGNVW
jgi:hypothetical protein